MLKIFIENLTGTIVKFKDDKIANHIEDFEKILVVINNITGKKAWRWMCDSNTKLVIELTPSGESIEEIEKILQELEIHERLKI
ncbi:MAG: hypothetical protein PHZ02_01410 [Desulfocapsaceae bacterium]|nr:hypothetical protein [Desulfocapsaceae bacterium]